MNGNNANLSKVVVYPTGIRDKVANTQKYPDVLNIQNALDQINAGGSILLKSKTEDGEPKKFYFGEEPNDEINILYLTKDVNIEGECEEHEENERGVNKGTTILGGRQIMWGVLDRSNNWIPISVTIKNIRFEGFSGGGIRICQAKGDSEISGCSFVNYHQGFSVLEGIQCAYPIVADSVGGPPNSWKKLSGNLCVHNNYFSAAPDVGNKSTGLHFSNCNLNFEFCHNTIIGMHHTGVAVYGNKNKTLIRGNDITIIAGRPKPNAGIAIGIFSPKMKDALIEPDLLYTDRKFKVEHNKVRIQSKWSHGIAVSHLLDPVHEDSSKDVLRDVIKNTVIMEDMNTESVDFPQAALACCLSCSNSTWDHNSVLGTAKFGMWFSNKYPNNKNYVSSTNIEMHQKNNKFTKNKLRKFTALDEKIFVDKNVTELIIQGNH